MNSFPRPLLGRAMKRIILILVCAILFSACVSEEKKLYQWENLEKELHELAIEAIAEKKKGGVADPLLLRTKDTNKRCGFILSGPFDEASNAMSFGFSMQERKIVDKLIQSLTRLHGEPNFDRLEGNTPEYFSESRTWENCTTWYYEIGVNEFSWAASDGVGSSPFVVWLRFREEYL